MESRGGCPYIKFKVGCFTHQFWRVRRALQVAGGDARATNFYIMQAAILAAGLGTRLRPLTYTTPKALVPVLNRPLLGVLLAQLKAAGALEVAVNTHHLAAQVENFLAAHPSPGQKVVVRSEPEILGTGGGLRNLAEALAEAPFLAVNADILTDLDLAAVFGGHHQDALATLVLHDCPPYNNVWLNHEGRVAGVGTPPPDPSGPPLAYTGIQVVSPRLLNWLPEQGPADLVAAWREALAQGERLAALVVTGHFWQDLGTPEAYLAAHQRLLSGGAPGLQRFFAPLSNPLLGNGTVLAAGVACAGGVCLGRDVRVGPGVRLKNTVIWDEAEIAPGVALEDCVVGRGARVRASARQTIVV
jgi:mannose-1-phosphate guanylyltransferase